MTTPFLKIFLMISLAATVLPPALAAQEIKSDRKPVSKQWAVGETFHLKGYDVTLSAPVLVAESKTRHLSIPTITSLANGDLVVVMSNHADVIVYPNTGVASFSGDGGLNWTEPVAFKHKGFVNLRLPSGDELLLPLYLALRKDGALSASYNLIRKGKRTLETREGGEVTGWPEPLVSTKADGTPVGTFYFEGQIVTLKNGNYFATLYGYYKWGHGQIAGAESKDGIRWKVVGTIASRSGKVNERGEEGPNEVALCRLKDGRLMCIYRLDSNLTYGQTWSDDEGRSWTEPVECRGPKSVEPSLAVLKDGTVLLSGGRPGLKFWVNRDGTGKDWQEVDIGKYRYKFIKNSDATGYTELVILDESHLLYVYDYGFDPPGCRVEVVRITLEKK